MRKCGDAKVGEGLARATIASKTATQVVGGLLLGLQLREELLVSIARKSWTSKSKDAAHSTAQEKHMDLFKEVHRRRLFHLDDRALRLGAVAPYPYVGARRGRGIMVDGERLMRLMSADDDLFIAKCSNGVRDMRVEAVRLINLAKYMFDEGDEEKCNVKSPVGPVWKETMPKG